MRIPDPLPGPACRCGQPMKLANPGIRVFICLRCDRAPQPTGVHS